MCIKNIGQLKSFKLQNSNQINISKELNTKLYSGIDLERIVKDIKNLKGTKISFKDFGLKDGSFISTNKALDLAEAYLEKGYKSLGKGRFLSKDGLRQVRMSDSDILGKHGGGPHMNFEKLKPNPSKPGKNIIIENYHIYLKD
jgi:hypothetical protein